MQQFFGYLAAVQQEEAARDARLLGLIALGSRGDPKAVTATVDRLQDAR